MSNQHKYNKQDVRSQYYEGTTFFKYKTILKRMKYAKSTLT